MVQQAVTVSWGERKINIPPHVTDDDGFKLTSVGRVTLTSSGGYTWHGSGVSRDGRPVKKFCAVVPLKLLVSVDEFVLVTSKVGEADTTSPSAKTKRQQRDETIFMTVPEV